MSFSFSFTLVQKIEDHADQITAQVLKEILRDPQLPTMRSLPQEELEVRAHHILRNLGRWLVAKDPEVADWSESLGRRRYEQSVPLEEIVRSLLIVKVKLIDFVRDQALFRNALQIHSGEELEYRVGRFFDDAVYYVVRGYQSAAARERRKTVRPQQVLWARAALR